MKVCFLFLVLLFVAVTIDLTWAQFRVKLGTNAQPGQFKFIAHLGWGFCSASILNEYTVLTAGHCVCGGKPPTVTVGQVKHHGASDNRAHDREFHYRVKDVIIHPAYNPASCGVDGVDFAIVKLERPIQFNNDIQPIQFDCQKVPIGQRILHIGYGYDDNGHLGNLNYGVSLITGYWQNRMESDASPSYVQGGDSGGPVVIENGDGTYRQVGVNSGVGGGPPHRTWSIYAPITEGCEFINKHL